MAYVGLGQDSLMGSGSSVTALPCDWFDSLMGTCVGAAANEGPQTGSYQCNWLQQLFSPGSCASAQTATPAPPNIPVTGAPSVTVNADGSITTETPQQTQQTNVASIQQQAVANAPVDCTQWYNQLFSSQCTCTYCSSMAGWGAVGVIGLVLLLALKK